MGENHVYPGIHKSANLKGFSNDELSIVDKIGKEWYVTNGGEEINIGGSFYRFEYISNFDVPQTREMVRKLGRLMGLKFEEIIYGRLTEDFGGHPFLIRQVCSTINSLCSLDRPVTVDKALYEKAKHAFNHMKTYLTQINRRYILMILERLL